MKNLKTLIIVESPNKSNTIKKYLGEEYLIRSSVGHISDLAPIKGCAFGIDINNGFKPKYKILPDKVDKVKSIIDAARQCKEVFLAMDKDREGEAIAYNIESILKKNTKCPIKRITFDEITKPAILKAISAPRDVDMNIVHAQQARRCIDRIVGFSVSPYLSSVFESGLSAGRVQSIGVKLVIEREREIKAFKKELFWNVYCDLEVDGEPNDPFGGGQFVAKLEERIISSERAKQVKKELNSNQFVVQSVIKKEKVVKPFPPLTTAKLQQVAANQLKLSTAATMQAAQSLYEKGYISYIRTDSTRISDEAQAAAKKWLNNNKFETPKIPNVYGNKDSAQDAHEAIRPTDIELKPNLLIGSKTDKTIYKLIWEFFIASQMKPATFDTVSATIKNGNHILKVEGKTKTYSGWMDILKNSSKDILLPELKKGELLNLYNIKVEKKETKPPPRFNEGILVKELEKRGIGRPSTYVSIISKITSKGYVTREKNIFYPTELGFKIIDEIDKFFSFMKYNYTAIMESDLDEISNGNKKYLDVMNPFFENFKVEIRKAYVSRYKDSHIGCEMCDGTLLLMYSKFGFYLRCSEYPSCDYLVGCTFDGDDIKIRPKHEVLDEHRCPICNSGMVRRDGRMGPYYSCSKYSKCLGKKKIEVKDCPKCGDKLSLMVLGGNAMLTCNTYPNCKHQEPLPEGFKLDWKSPKEMVPAKIKEITAFFRKECKVSSN